MEMEILPHLAATRYSKGEVVRELVSLSPATLLTMNKVGAIPLVICIGWFLEMFPVYDMKLPVLLETSPQAAQISISCSRNSYAIPLHEVLNQNDPLATLDQIAMVLAAYREAVSISEDNMRNLSVILPEYGSVANLAVQ